MKTRRGVVAKAIAPKLDRRVCHRKGCGRRFSPVSPTHFHCTEECAWACLKARLRL